MKIKTLVNNRSGVVHVQTLFVFVAVVAVCGIAGYRVYLQSDAMTMREAASQMNSQQPAASGGVTLSTDKLMVLPKEMPMQSATAQQMRSSIVAIAKSQVGNSETSDNRGTTIAKYQAWSTKYKGSRCSAKLRAAWCAAFATWVYSQATGRTDMNDCSIRYLKKQAGSRYHKTLAGMMPGDLIINAKSSHIGVYVGRGDNNTIKTIEGNAIRADGSQGVTALAREASYWGSYIDVLGQPTLQNGGQRKN